VAPETGLVNTDMARAQTVDSCERLRLTPNGALGCTAEWGSLHALPTQDHVLGDQKPANREILVELRPMDSYAAAYETPVAEGIETRVAELWKPFERHCNRAAVLEMNDKLTFDDLDRGGSGLLRC
jgi:hypothetical protein